MQKAGMIRQLAAGAAMTRMLTSCDALATDQLAAMEKLMGDFSKTFEWLDFPEGRIRYAGGKRGRDEPPIETFAEGINGHIYYGEVRKSFLPDRHNYILEIVSFGWFRHDWFGTEPDPAVCAAFKLHDLRKAQSLVCQAVPEWLKLEDRPSILTEFADSHFMGEIAFRNGWALVRDAT